MRKQEPIISFSKVREAMERKGMFVNSQEYGYIPSTHIISNIVANNGQLEISSEGIFYVADDGNKQKGYLYLLQNAEGWSPKAHICECSTLRDSKLAGRTSRYGWANRSSVFVKSSLSGQVFQVDELQICKNCLSELNAYKILNFPKTTKEFVKRLEDGTDNELFSHKKELDRMGNTSDWFILRRRYMTSMNFLCCNCQRDFSQIDQQMFLEVFHKDRNKTNNMTHNLICLCVECQEKMGFASNLNLLSLYRNNYDPSVKRHAIAMLLSSIQSTVNRVFFTIYSISKQ